MVCLVSLLSAQAPEAVKLADEPLHHLKIDNEYVRAYYVEVAPHKETQLHRHDHDYVFVSLGASDVISAVPGKPEVHLVLKDGEIRFARGGFAHVARNMSDAPFRTVAIELLRPQGDPRNLCDKVVDGPLGHCDQPGNSRSEESVPGRPFIARPIFETDAVRAVSNSLGAKARYSNSPKFAELFVVANDSELQIDRSGEPSTILRGGEMVWLDAGQSATVSCPLDHGSSRYVVLFFKDGKTGEKPAH